MVVVDNSKLFSGRIPQILATVTGTLNAISDGMQYGWSSPIVPILESPSSPVKITSSDIEWIENTLLLGGLMGISLTIYLVDKLGRMLISAVENLIAWLLLIFASSIEVILIARFLTGMAGDCNFVVAPMYVAEIADKKIRGRLGSLVFIMMLLGIVLIYAMGPFISIAASSSVGAVVITQLLTFSFMPESPYYLLIKNRKVEARKALQILRASENVDDELEEIAQSIEKQNQSRGRPLELFTVKSNRKAVIITLVLNFAQHFSGISVILMNLHMILSDATTSMSPSIIAIIFSVLMLVACAFSTIFIDHLGRKILLYSSCFTTGISLLILATYFACKDNGINVDSYNWVPVVTIISYAITFKGGLGFIPIVLTAELFPTNVKTLGCTISDAMYTGCLRSCDFIFKGPLNVLKEGH